MRIVALVPDLMDRSRLTTALADVESADLVFAGGPDDCGGADVVVVDLARHGSAVASVRGLAPSARIVAFGRHTEHEQLERAHADGADVVLPRSRFFHDPASAVI